VKVIFTDEAKAEVRRRRAWWKRHRDETSLFTQELRRAQRELKSAPKLAVHGRYEGHDVRRLSLGRVHCFVYYVILEAERRVEIVSVWGQERGSQPDFVEEE